MTCVVLRARTVTPIASPDPQLRTEPPFQSFWMGGFEGADHVNGDGVALDMVHGSGHLAALDADYAAAARMGIRTVRESIGWRLAEPEPGRFDLARAETIARCAASHGVQVLWSLMHYGTPGDLSLFDEHIVERFAAFAAAVARHLAPWQARAPVYTPINEIGFLSWAVSSTNDIWPYRVPQGAGSTEHSGYAVKCRLVRAALAAMRAMREVDPRCRFLHVEPIVHVAAPRAQPELADLARQVCSYQWQAWDLIAGRLQPDLGGHPAALDLIGVNHYHSGQWEVGTERRLSWREHDERRRPLSALLADVWQRYGRPLIVSETSHVEGWRAPWLNEVAAEVRLARTRGAQVDGVCLYPLIDRFDWNRPQQWHHSGLWDVSDAPADAPRRTPPTERLLCIDYAAALARWQRVLPGPGAEGTPMTTVIVFSHLRWEFVYQRPQQLMSRLAESFFRVLFIEEPVRSEGPARLVCRPQGPNLDVLVPHTALAAQGFHDDQLPLLRPLLDAYVQEHGLHDSVVWFYTPMALPLINPLRPRMVVYDCMDELAAFKDAPRQLRQRETALLKLADLVLAGGPSLYEAKRALHPDVHYLPSAVDAAHFAPREADHDDPEGTQAERLLADVPHPRLGYFGVIDERIDLALLDALATARPEWQLVMVGPVVKIDPAGLPQRPNIHWLGLQPYARLPHLLARWDVCLMPFAINEATRFISPTKTLEYLAGEKPVVSTPVADVVSLYGDVVRIARSAREFVDGCAALLAETPWQRSERLARMVTTVHRMSWDQHAREVARLLRAHLDADSQSPSAVASSPRPAPRVRATATVRRSLREVRHVVIGAGPTGLAAALHLGEGAARSDTLLVEREQRVGGWCRSVQQQGYTFDHAGHILFSTDPVVLKMYDRLLGDNLQWHNREAWIYSKNVYTRYPFQGSLYGLPPQVLKECLVGAIEARFGPLRGGERAPTVSPPANFEEFIERVWGRGIGEHFAWPYNRKLWTVPLSEMETSWLGGRVPLPDLEQMIEGALKPTAAPMGPNARFGYPLRGGFQALMDAFVPLLNCELELGTGVLQVSPTRRTVRLDDGRIVGYRSLISTMPLPRLVEACGDEAPPEVHAAARALRHVGVRCVNLGVGLPPGQRRLNDKHWVYYPEDTLFHRIFLQGNASPHNSPPGEFGLTCEISYSVHKPLPCDGAALVERVVSDCRRVGMLGEHNPVRFASQLDMPCAYVVYDHERPAHVATIRRWLDGTGIVLAGRYAEWEYYNSDHAFLAGRRAAEQARRALPLAALAEAS